MLQRPWFVIAMLMTLDIGSRLCPVLGQPIAITSAVIFMAMAVYWLRTALKQSEESVHDSVIDSPPDGLPRWLIGLMLIQWLANVLICSRPRLHVSPVQVLILGAGALILGHALLRRNTRHLVLLMILLGAALRVASFRQAPAYGDMMPLVQLAMDNLLKGSQPYVLYHMPWSLPLVYPPVTWLSYLPPYVLGADIRMTNLLLELGIGGLLVWVARQPHLVLQIATYIYVTEAETEWSLNTTHLPFWFLAVLLLALLFRGRQIAAAVVFGLCLAASPLSAVVAPFLLLFLFRNRPRLQAVGLCALAAAVAAVIYLPFVLWNASGLVFGLLRWHNSYEHIAFELWKLNHQTAEVGLNGLLYGVGLYSAMKPLQALAIVVLLVIYYRHGATLRLLGPVLIAALAIFLGLNPLVHIYYYVIVLMVGLVTLSYEQRLRSARPRTPALASSP